MFDKLALLNRIKELENEIENITNKLKSITKA